MTGELVNKINVELKEKYPRYNPHIGTYSAFRICALVGAETAIREVVEALREGLLWRGSSAEYADEIERLFLGKKP